MGLPSNSPRHKPNSEVFAGRVTSSNLYSGKVTLLTKRSVSIRRFIEEEKKNHSSINGQLMAFLNDAGPDILREG